MRKLIIGGIVDRSKPQANISDATRGYRVSTEYAKIIKAYHTSNPITPERKYELEIMLGDAARKCCFVTAFENQAAYRSCPEDLAWETEVWVATQPDHMIHLNGSRFQGPYERSNKVL